MTLDTHVLIFEPVPHREVFDFCLGLVSREFAGEPRWEYRPGYETVIEKTGYRYWTAAGYVTTCGQGLPAWLFVRHAEDSPLRYYDDESIEWNVKDDPAWQVPEWNRHLLHVDIDTPYGYRHPKTRAGCSDLHAWFVRELLWWLEDRGVTKVIWQNEFTGEWYPSADDVGVLGDPDKGELLCQT